MQIEVGITGTNRRKLISTGVRLHGNRFSNKNGFTCRNHPDAPLVTGNVTRMFQEVKAFVLSENAGRLTM